MAEVAFFRLTAAAEDCCLVPARTPVVIEILDTGLVPVPTATHEFDEQLRAYLFSEGEIARLEEKQD